MLESLESLEHLDRRWIFVAVFLSALLPMVMGLRLPIGEPTESVKQLYREIKNLPDGSAVLCSFDFEGGGETECGPTALVTMRQLFRKHCHLVITALWPAGTSEARRYTGQIVAEMKAKGTPLTYGTDFVILGYKPGNGIVPRLLANGFSTLYPTDADGTPIDKLPMMAHVNKYGDLSFLISYAVGMPGIREWINVVPEYGVKIGGACTAVSAPEYSPFLNSGQLCGLAAGLRGAADYETLAHEPGLATVGMTIQSSVTLLVLALIVFSNIIYFAGRRRKTRRSGGH